MSAQSNIFASLGGAARIWAVAAIHGEAEQVNALHSRLWGELRQGDKLVYLGNYSGRGKRVRETIDQLLLFRRALLARGDVGIDDIVYLRGQQEEMWQKLLQLQFAPNPTEVLQWMAGHGIASTIEAYDGSIDKGFLAIREGILSLTRWTNSLRQAMREYDGHTALMSTLRHAAFTNDHKLLLVHAGLDPARPLSAQSDAFWWGGAGFAAGAAPYNEFQLVVRGFDRKRGGTFLDDHWVTLDSGCGFDGKLAAMCFQNGRPGELIEV